MGGIGFPQEEIRRVALGNLVFFQDAAARSGDELGHVIAREPAVFGEGSHAKINHAISGDVRVALGQERLDHRLNGVDVFGGPRHVARIVVRDFDAECAGVLNECVREVLRDLIRVVRVGNPIGQGAGFFRFFEFARSHRDFVFARGIGHVIVGHVPHVRDVHDVGDAVPGQFQKAAEHVREQKGFEVADVGKIVHGWTAGIHRHMRGIERFKNFRAIGQGIVKSNVHNCVRGVGVKVKMKKLSRTLSIAIASTPQRLALCCR